VEATLIFTVAKSLAETAGER